MSGAEQLLASVQRRFEANDVANAISSLESGLSEIRKHVSSDEWGKVCQLCVAHSVSKFVYQDPLTRWAYEKPRGYAGDAVLMDFIYRWPSIEPEIAAASELGRAVYEYSRHAPAVTAVRFRLETLVRLIDEFADKTQAGPEILSIASGHVREAHLAKAVKARRFRRFVALDQDPETTILVRNELSHYGVEAVTESARAIIRGKCELGQFDLIYSVGLSDYLPTGVFKRLFARMFSMLNPGGQILIPNFLPNTLDAGFMEAFMDWHLIYRDKGEMIELAKTLPRGELEAATVHTFTDLDQNIIFLQVTKAS